MSGIVPIRIRIPSEEWHGLTERAHQAGHTSATALVQSIVDDFVSSRNHEYREKEQSAVEFWHARGLTNKEIAEHTHMTVQAIRRRLANAGLNSNREKKSA